MYLRIFLYSQTTYELLVILLSCLKLINWTVNEQSMYSWSDSCNYLTFTFGQSWLQVTNISVHWPAENNWKVSSSLVVLKYYCSVDAKPWTWSKLSHFRMQFDSSQNVFCFIFGRQQPKSSFICSAPYVFVVSAGILCMVRQRECKVVAVSRKLKIILDSRIWPGVSRRKLMDRSWCTLIGSFPIF